MSAADMARMDLRMYELGTPQRYPGSFPPGAPRGRGNEWIAAGRPRLASRQRAAATGVAGLTLYRLTATVAAGRLPEKIGCHSASDRANLSRKTVTSMTGP